MNHFDFYTKVFASGVVSFGVGLQSFPKLYTEKPRDVGWFWICVFATLGPPAVGTSGGHEGQVC